MCALYFESAICSVQLLTFPSSPQADSHEMWVCQSVDDENERKFLQLALNVASPSIIYVSAKAAPSLLTALQEIASTLDHSCEVSLQSSALFTACAAPDISAVKPHSA
jgi:hypothetical protein